MLIFTPSSLTEDGQMKRKGSDFWKARIDEQRRLGISAAEYCRRRSLHRQTFLRWRTRLARETAASGLVEIRGTRDRQRLDKPAALSIRLERGILIRFHELPNPETPAATPTTMPWRRRSMVYSRPRLSGAEGRGGIGKPSSVPRSSGYTGSTPSGCSSRSGISLLPSSRNRIMMGMKVGRRSRTQLIGFPANPGRFIDKLTPKLATMVIPAIRLWFFMAYLAKKHMLTC